MAQAAALMTQPIGLMMLKDFGSGQGLLSTRPGLS